MDVYIKGRIIRTDPRMSIGKGGEADVYKIGRGLALKVFKPPNHPDYNGQPKEQEGARKRIEEHQRKLPQFPRNLPRRVVTPQELATNKTGKKILGYVMRLIPGAESLMRYGEISFRAAGISNDMTVGIFRDLHKTVREVHPAHVIMGDFNDLNVLIVQNVEAYIIDADSFQFGQFPCRVFTTRFVDPLLCDHKEKRLVLNRVYTFDSDWYAFAIMLMQSLLFVGPYGGIYRPKKKTNRMPHDRRPLYRITIFHPEVKYPGPAVHYKVLPDDLLQYFHLVFEKDQRGEFPLALLESLKWIKCDNCGLEHARNICPECAQVAPAAVKEVVVIRGKVAVRQIFRTHGLILFATYQNSKPLWLYHENDEFRREDKSLVLQGGLDPLIRYRIRGNSTLMGKNGQLFILVDGQQPDRLNIDSYATLPIFDANKKACYWVHMGQLMRDGILGPEYIGDVLANQTLFWVGEHFGFGFYRAGSINVAFIFDAQRRGINDRVILPPIRGQLIDSTCVFDKERCWFFVTTQEANRRINQCIVVKRDGLVEATAQTEQGDDSWLGTLRGKCAASNFLLAATDEGIIRVEIDQDKIMEKERFPDTESFVHSGHHMFISKEGLYIIGSKEISTLTIKR